MSRLISHWPTKFVELDSCLETVAAKHHGQKVLLSSGITEEETYNNLTIFTRYYRYFSIIAIAAT